MKALLLISLVLIITTKLSKSVCPEEEIIEPCTCYLDNVDCTGTTMFTKMEPSIDTSFKYTFHSLTIINWTVTEMVDDMFRDYSFSEIIIKNAIYLKRIHAYAFTAISDKIETFQHLGPSLLGEEDKYVPELFLALSSLTNVKTIYLDQTKIKYIPRNAFSNINQNKLTHLQINTGMISNVGDNAFYYLNSLTYMGLERQLLNHIAMHAFDLEKASTSSLEIVLSNNLIEDSSIDVNAFVGSKRQISLNLGYNLLTHLKEYIFKPILTANFNTKIDVTGNPFRCNCPNGWLVMGKADYGSRVINAVCTDTVHQSQSLFSLKRADFDICDGYFV